MMCAYGAIAREIVRCMRERAYFCAGGETRGGGNYANGNNSSAVSGSGDYIGNG